MTSHRKAVEEAINHIQDESVVSFVIIFGTDEKTGMLAANASDDPVVIMHERVNHASVMLDYIEKTGLAIGMTRDEFIDFVDEENQKHIRKNGER